MTTLPEQRRRFAVTFGLGISDRTTERLRIVAENQQAQFQLLAWKAGLATNQLNMITDNGIHTHAIVSSKDAQLVVSGHQGGIVRLLNRTTGIDRPLLPHPGDVCSLALSPDGRLGVSADQFGNLAVWFVETGERIGTLTQPTPSSPHAAPVRPAFVFSPDNTHTFVLSANQLGMGWNSVNGPSFCKS